MTTVVDVKVRNTFQTYAASAKGLRATCTAGPEHAVRALAHKLFPDRPASSKFVRRDGHVEFWRIVA